MAGIDDDFQGEARPARWAKVGYLPQEPQLEVGLTVGQEIEKVRKDWLADLMCCIKY